MAILSRSIQSILSAKTPSWRRIAPFIRGLILLATCLTSVEGMSQSQITLSFPEPHNIVVLSVPDKAPALQVDLRRLNVDSNSLRPDLAGRRLEASDSQGFVFSSFIFPRDQRPDSRALREEEWAALRKGAAKDGFNIQQFKMYDRGSIPMLEYMLEDVRGQRAHQKNIFGYIVSGDMAMDFHISKWAYTPQDQNLLDSLVDGVKLIEDYKPDSKLEFGYGSIFYLQKEWPRAVAHYERALEQEKAKRKLPPAEWKVLVDNLGMAYDLSGNLPKAETTFEYGIHEDPTYPMFHYNLACTYAEAHDLDKALEELKVAFQYRNNSIPGEGMPDPAKDDSFKRYLANPRFQTLAKEVCPSSTRTFRGWMCK